MGMPELLGAYDKYKVYETENTWQTKATFKNQDGRVELSSGFQGICGGQSALWCLHILSGKKGAESKPSYLRAASLQVRSEGLDGAVDRGEDQMFEPLGLRCVDELSKPTGEAALHMMSSDGNGVYMVGIPGHYMAAATRPGEYLFFNPDYGMWSLPTMFVFEDIVTCGRSERMWKLYQMALA